MRLKEQTGLSLADLPMDAFKTHLRLGSGFGEDTLQDSVLEAALRAAITSVEARTGKALIQRTFIWQTSAWRDPDAQALPIAPVESLSWAKTVTRSGDEVSVDLDTVALERSTQRSMLRAVHATLPTIPTYGYVEIGFVAGFAADWTAMPSDLTQAVMILATHFYEARDGGDGHLPVAATQLLERYRTVRILGGSAA